MVIRAEANGPLVVREKLLKDLSGSSDEAQGRAIPVAPTLGTFSAKDKAARDAVAKGYSIIIPSYDRPELLRDRTLKMLVDQGVALERIFVFVADNAELGRYAAVLGQRWKPRSLLGEARTGEGNLVVGKLGIRAQRKYMSQFFPDGQYLISLDDDVSDVCKLEYFRACRSMKVRWSW